MTECYDCVVAEQLQKVEWRCAEMGSGEQCVMTLGIEMTPALYADNWDSLPSVSYVTRGCSKEHVLHVPLRDP